MLAAKCLKVSYGGTTVLKVEGLEVPRGCSLSIVGGSGCGKTSLLKALFGLLPPGCAEGKAELFPKDAKKAYVFQEHGLFPWKDSMANLSLPWELEGKPKKARAEAARALFSELGLEGLEKRYPSELSGGERQRLAVGRALASGASLILLDEPFSSLDAIARERLQESASDLFLKKGLASVLATHGIEEAVFMGDRVAVMGGGRPSSFTAVFDNPRRREKGFRYQEGFFALVSEVRKALEDSR